MNFLGIDPGPKSGGLAIVTNQKEIFKLTVMPPTERDLYEFLSEFRFQLWRQLWFVERNGDGV
jgi:hypothetical protein